MIHDLDSKVSLAFLCDSAGKLETVQAWDANDCLKALADGCRLYE